MVQMHERVREHGIRNRDETLIELNTVSVRKYDSVGMTQVTIPEIGMRNSDIEPGDELTCFLDIEEDCFIFIREDETEVTV